MVKREELEEPLKKEISKLRDLGEGQRKSSDHLYYRSLIKFESGKIKEKKKQGEKFYEITCKYDIYTETEFLHTPDQDEDYTEHYKDKFIFDRDFKLIETMDLRK